MTVTGTPTLAAGALGIDPDQGLRWNGTTNSASAPDSASLSVTGSMSLECFVSFDAFPGATQKFYGKDSSYALRVTPAGKLEWKLDNGAATITVTSATTLVLGRKYHVIGVLNTDYAGAPSFGNPSPNGSTTPILGDFFQGSASGYQNKMASRFTLLERALLTSIVLDLVRTPDSTLNEFVRAHIYAGTTIATATLVAQSADLLLSSSSLPARALITFPIAALAEPGDYWVGVAGGESSAAFSIGCENSGGASAYKNDLLSDGLSDPFGTPGSTDGKILGAYVNYTPIARTGLEGKALLYINGGLDGSANYTGGIADNANALQVAPAVACFTDERSLWGHALTGLEIAQHYTAAAGQSLAAAAPPPPAGSGIYDTSVYDTGTYGA